MRGALSAFDCCIAVEPDVDVESLALVTTILGWETITGVTTLRDVLLFCRDIIGAPAVGPEDDAEGV